MNRIEKAHREQISLLTSLMREAGYRPRKFNRVRRRIRYRRYRNH